MGIGTARLAQRCAAPFFAIGQGVTEALYCLLTLLTVAPCPYYDRRYLRDGQAAPHLRRSRLCPLA